MHILYEIEHLSTSGGIERILTDKANHMADEWGWDVTIVVLLEEDGKPFFPLSANVRVEYLHVKTKGLLMCAQALWRLNKLVKRLNPDVYVTFQTIGALSCLLRTHSVPTVYEAHGIRTCMQHPRAMAMADRYSDAVVVLTDDNAKRYARNRRVVKIPNFTNIRSDTPADYTIRHCVALGRLDFEKNYTRMIDIWAQIHQSNPEWVLDIYGEGSERQQLEKHIQQLGLTDCVILHGATTDVVKALHGASVYLMTSRFEGFGLVLIEAGVCGLPSVAFDCDDGPREIIQDGENGYLVPNAADRTFADNLRILIDNKFMREQMGASAIEISKAFDKANIMQQWHDLFTDLVKK